jgi:hypothetical protein
MLASEEPISIRSSPLGCALAPAAVANQSRRPVRAVPTCRLSEADDRVGRADPENVDRSANLIWLSRIVAKETVDAALDY